MAALQASGLLPTGHRGLPSEVISRTFFSSSTQRALRDHSAAGPVPVLRATSDGAKYKEVSLKANGWRYSTGFRPKKEDCLYQRDYTEKPLDNAPADRALCKLWSTMGRDGGQVPKGLAFNSESTHRLTYPPRKGPQPPRAESYKPESLPDPTSTLMVTEGTSHAHFPMYQEEQARRFRGELATWTAGPPVPTACEAGAASSSLKRAHSASALAGSVAPTTWRAGKPGRTPPPGECW